MGSDTPCDTREKYTKSNDYNTKNWLFISYCREQKDEGEAQYAPYEPQKPASKPCPAKKHIY